MARKQPEKKNETLLEKFIKNDKPCQTTKKPQTQQMDSKAS